MAMVEISDNTIDELFKDYLARDYLALLENIYTMEDKVRNGIVLEEYQREDLANWLRTSAAINVLLDYYFVESDAIALREEGTRFQYG